MKVRILESARRDLRAGYDFYERQERGVGEYFLDALLADIDSLTLYGGIHSLKFGFHCMLASRFPYAVYYRLEKEVGSERRSKATNSWDRFWPMIPINSKRPFPRCRSLRSQVSRS